MTYTQQKRTDRDRQTKQNKPPDEQKSPVKGEGFFFFFFPSSEKATKFYRRYFQYRPNCNNSQQGDEGPLYAQPIRVDVCYDVPILVRIEREGEGQGREAL